MKVLQSQRQRRCLLLLSVLAPLACTQSDTASVTLLLAPSEEASSMLAQVLLALGWSESSPPESKEPIFRSAELPSAYVRLASQPPGEYRIILVVVGVDHLPPQYLSAYESLVARLRATLGASNVIAQPVGSVTQ